VLNTGVKNMSQVVSQTQNSSQTPTPVFKIFTWGRFRYGDLEVIYPKRVSLAKLTSRRGENVLETDLFTVKYRNNDSNRNLDREVEFINVKQPLLIRYRGSRSASKSFDEVYLIRQDGDKVVTQQLEIKERTFDAEVGKYKVTYLEKYVEFEDNEIRLETVEIGKEVIQSKLVVRLYRENSKVIASGDTYNVKEVLKSLGFKWDSFKRVWYSDKADIAEVKAVLSNHINVEVNE
jgi:hypothetical protein